MEILVCVKQVPDTAEVKIDPVKHTVIRAGVPNIFNPFDQNALEAALQMKDADKGIEQFDIILCGKQAIDGDTAQVGPQIACELGIPQITYARDIKVEGNKVTVQQENEEGYIVTEANFPVLITAVKDLNEPRFPTIRGTMKAKRREIPNLDAAAVAADDAQIGLSGSPTKVRKIFTPPQRSGGLVLKVEDDNEQAIVDQIMEKLVAQKII